MSSCKNTNRVKFMDEHMANYEHESSALHRKLQSKNEALKIMRAELERFRTERDQFKIMAETIQMRYSAIKNSLETSGNDITFEGSSSTLGYLLNQSREKNIALQTETETSRQKLHELQGDIKLLRTKNLEMSKALKLKANSRESVDDDATKAWNEEKSKLIDQLEGLKKKNAHLQFDFRSLLDEKEEIVNEREAFKCKVHRLNHELNVALKGEGTIDIDSLVLENKFLNDRVDNLTKELDHSKQSHDKLQSMLKTKRVKGSIKFGNSNKEMIMSHKQVTKLLGDGANSELKAATNEDLKALCLALLDNLNDKTISLSHQKQTNRLLAAKIGTLEMRIKSISGDSTHVSSLTPSQLLLDNYASAKVDEDLRLPKVRKEIAARNGESSESTRSMISSEYETQSTSDMSSELKQLNYIKIIADDDDELLESDESFMKYLSSSDLDTTEELTVLPPDIQKLVDDAMKSSESITSSLDSETRPVESYQ